MDQVKSLKNMLCENGGIWISVANFVYTPEIDLVMTDGTYLETQINLSFRNNSMWDKIYYSETILVFT